MAMPHAKEGVHMRKIATPMLVNVVCWSVVAVVASAAASVLALAIIGLLGQDKLRWGLVALAWMLAHLGEFKDIAGSPCGVVEGSFLERFRHYCRRVKFARLWFRLAEWSVAALAAYVITQM